LIVTVRLTISGVGFFLDVEVVVRSMIPPPPPAPPAGLQPAQQWPVAAALKMTATRTARPRILISAAP
jgi:hypothetical protein